MNLKFNVVTRPYIFSIELADGTKSTITINAESRTAAKMKLESLTRTDNIKILEDTIND